MKNRRLTHKKGSAARWLNAWRILTALALAVISGLFPQTLPGAGVPIASAHNLQTRMVYMYFDPATQALLDARAAAGGGSPTEPLLRAGDEVGLIIKVVPRDGTNTGVGGHIDFYVPNGVTVIDAAYVIPDGAGGFIPVAMKGQSPIAIGDGSIGAKVTSQLIGLTDIYTSTATGLASTAVNPATGLHLGTIAGLYGDTGIFFATDPDTAYGSWQRYTGDWNANPALNRCGSLAFTPANGKTLINNSGDTVVPCNKWDAEQLMAWGVKGGTFGQSAPIVDYADGRGNAPWGFAAGVAGPQSGYAWHFDWDEWQASSKTAADMRAAMSPDEIGPWQRIRYPGSRISYDQPGLKSTAIGYANVDASNVGFPLSPSTPLTPTVSQTDTTSPKTIRWAVGQLTQYRPEYVWVQVRVNDPAAGITDPNGCISFRGDTFGGDAGGTDQGKDHLWRYYEPTEVSLNACVAAGKPATKEFLKVGEVIQYKVKVYNLQNFTLTNVVVRDTLPGQVQFLSATPAQNSGPNPLVWNVGTLLPGQKFEATVTVKATSTGPLDNCMEISSAQLPAQTVCDSTQTDTYPYLVPTKTVDKSSIAPGEKVQYTITVKNIGTGPTASPVTIDEYLPEGFTFVSKDSVTVNGANLTANTTVTTASPYSPNRPRFSVPVAINAGQSLVIVFTAQAPGNAAAGSYCNYYAVTQGGIPLTTGSLACVAVGGGQIGDTIWRDWNGDGVQDAGEEGIEGVTVKLYAGDGTTLLATTATDADGRYLFAGLAAGTYVVEVNNGVPLLSTTPSGDPDGVLDNRHTVALAANQQYLTADFGYQPGGGSGYGGHDISGIIGDRVFEDVGNDGAFTEGVDTGIPGVTVYLYEDSNGDGAITPGVDALVGTRVTDADGIYGFSFLGEKYDYVVYVNPNDPALAAYFGADPYRASTANPHPVDYLIGSYLDADFGFWRVQPGAIGDAVCFDANGNGLCDAGETGLPNVTVTLVRDQNGNGLADAGEPTITASTSITGYYTFANLGPGSYLVVVDTDDPDLPPSYLPVVESYALTLSAGQQVTTADFPFTQALTKAVNRPSANPGDTLFYTLTLNYKGDALFSDVRIIDALPTGTTFVTVTGSSPSAGGTYGPYASLAGVPGIGEDEPTTGHSTGNRLTASPVTVAQGGTITVTMQLTATTTIAQVTPSLTVNGGDATCSGPSPAAPQDVNAGTPRTFTFTCTPTTLGVFTFVGNAEGAAGYSFPEATSNSVLVSQSGGANVITWNLGSNTPRSVGQVVSGGALPGIYAFQGGTTAFWRYGPLANSWATRAATPNNIKKGGALAYDGTYIYGLRGDKQKTFYRYTIGTPGSWTTLANTSDKVDEGGALVYLKVGSTDYIFALLGNSNLFRRYQITAPAGWSNMANTPATVKKGGALTTDGTYIYALQGDTKTGFWRCNATTSGSPGSCNTSWTVLSSIPTGVGWGGSLTYLNDYIYALSGNNTKKFYRYGPLSGTPAWSDAPADTPGNVADGGALTNDGTYIYALQGKTNAFWRYNPATNTWTVMANALGAVAQGGALVFVPGTGTVDRQTTLDATPTLVSTGTAISVTMGLLSNTGTVANVVPSSPLTVTASGASASCSGPVPASQTVVSGTVATFAWNCTLSTTGAATGMITFTASAGSGGTAGNAVAVYGSAHTTNPNNAVGAPDGNVADIAATSGNYLTLDLGSTVPNGTVITLRLRYRLTAGSAVPVADVDGGTDGSTFSGLVTFSSLTTTLANYNYTVSQAGGIRYLRVRARATAGNPPDQYVGVDAVSFTVAGTQFAAASSESVIVVPPLTFRATVNNPPGVNTVNNQATLIDGSGALSPKPSNTTSTAVTGNIGDTVWADLDGNGSQGAGEPGLAGVQVCAFPAGGGPAAGCATTDALGFYRIVGLTAGSSYHVALTPATIPAGYTATTPATLTRTATVAGVYDADFGLRPPGAARIGDTVWLDADEDGVLDADEQGLPGITVRLYDSTGATLLATTRTNASGVYTFTALHAGTYRVQVDTSSVVTTSFGVTSTLGAAMDLVSVAGSTTPPLNNPLTVVVPTDSSIVDTADFGFNWAGAIGDYVWWDNNRNRQQDESPATPIAHAAVLLYYDANGNGVLDLVGQPGGDTDFGFALTNGSGLYRFDNLPPGRYLVDVYEDSITTNGVRNVVPTTSDIVFVNLGPGQSYLEADFGYYVGALVQGNVFWDENRNGVLDPGEQDAAHLLNNVTVSIVCLGPDGVVGGGDDYSASMESGADGLPAGHYRFVTPAGPCTLTYDEGDIPAVYGDRTTPTVYDFIAVAGEDWHPSFDFGVDNSGRIGDTVYVDADGDQAQDPGEPGLAGVTVFLYDSTGAILLDVAVTDAKGRYLFIGVADGTYRVVPDDATAPHAYDRTTPNVPYLATVSSGGSDLDADFGYRYAPGGGTSTVTLQGTVWEDVNGDQVRQAESEPLIADALVVVTCVGGTAPGTYLAETSGISVGGNWLVAGIPKGYDCTIDVDESTLSHSAYVATTPAMLTVTNLTSNVYNLDFGYRQQLGSLAGTVVWGDGDGIAEPGELPLAGVTITLRYAGADGFLGTADDVISTTLTSAGGAYAFTGLLPGLYQIVETNPPNFISLADRDGGNPDNITISWLGVGQALTGQDFEDAPLTGVVYGHLFVDLDGNGSQGAGEPNLPGIQVVITDSLGLTRTVTTDASGNYTATVPAGPTTADVVEATLPAGYVQTAGADPSTVVAPAGATTSLGEDGYQPQGLLTGDVFLDLDADGAYDPDEGLPGVRVVITPSAGAAFTVTTDATGRFTVTVPAGSTIVDVVNADLPAGAFQTVGADPSSVVIPAAGSGHDTNGYVTPFAAFGDFMWLDDGDGEQEAGETLGLPLVPILVTGLDASGAKIQITTTASITGYYWIANLLPGTYTVTVPVAHAGYAISTSPVRTFTLTQGAAVRTDIDFGYVIPTGVRLLGFTAAAERLALRLEWQVAQGDGVAAPRFHVWRAVAGSDAWKRLTSDPVEPAPGQDGVLAYTYTDLLAERGVAYLYRLEADDGTTFGPWPAQAWSSVLFLPLLSR